MNGKLIALWSSALHDLSPEDFRCAAGLAVQNCKFWPTPADIKSLLAKQEQEALPSYYTPFSLPMPTEPPITLEEKKQILEGMSEGGRAMLLQVIYGDNLNGDRKEA